MTIIEKHNFKVEKLIHDYELLQAKNANLQFDINELTNMNDELLKANQDMLLKIDSLLALSKVKKSE